MLSFDLETELIARGYQAPLPVAAAWSRGAPVIGLIADFLPVFKDSLASDELMVGQNVAYDFACMCTYDASLIPAVFDKYRRGQVRDIMLNEKLIRLSMLGATDPAYGLGALCDIYKLPAVDKDSSWRLEFAQLRNVPVQDWPSSAREYLLADADRPLRIYHEQMGISDKWAAARGFPILGEVAGTEAYKAFVCHLISCKGMYTDEKRTRAFYEMLTQALESVRGSLLAAGLVRKDGTKIQKAAEAYVKAACERLGIPVKYTKTKHVALGKDVLDAIPDELCEAYSIYSQAGSYVSRAEDMLQGTGEHPLQVRFNSLLETGRTSTSKPSPPLIGVQAQNFPRKIAIAKHDGKTTYASIGARECLRPSAPGRVFVSNDLPTAELRSVAQQCYEWFGASVLRDVINAGKDVHSHLAAPILGMSYDDVIRRKEEPSVKEGRDNAKPGNFGFWGGMMPKSFMSYAWKGYRVRFTLEKATQIRDFWAAAWPEQEPFFARVSSMIGTSTPIRWEDEEGKTRWIQTALLYFPYNGRWRAKVPYTAACNSFFQPRTAAGAAAGLQEVQRRCFSVPGSALYGSWAVMYTHDEIVLDSPADRAHDAAMELAAVMAEEFNRYHPDVAITSGDPVVSHVYSKSMKQKKDATGRLIPWGEEYLK